MDGRERFLRLSTLFENIAGLSAGEQRDAILRECGDDLELAGELRHMLACDAAVDEGEDPVWDIIVPMAEALTRPSFEGRTIGSWRVLRVLGEGGMGTVYLAERADGEFESKAAIKLVHGELSSPGGDQRFRVERQILARLSHRGIARLLDGGTTDDGSAYLVMEFVDGETIAQWCRTKPLQVRRRIELFLEVCDAVAYAHRNLVAHLDLKPSNVLVDGDGAVKLLDFGIAKLLDADEEDDRGTPTGMRMTPAYASPEQLQGEPAGVAADVYSLGVILFELLTGRLPFADKGEVLGNWVRAVVGHSAPLASSVAPRGRRGRLRGGLDAIVAKALRKDPRQRYLSVQDLAEDLRRHLDGRAVLARGADLPYQAARFLRRNGIAVMAISAVLVGSLGFARYAVLQAQALEVQRDEAERQQLTAQRVSTFLQEILTEADPNAASGRDVTIRQVLDRGAERLQTELEDEPQIRADLAVLLGRAYRSWGDYDVAGRLLDLAIDLYGELETVDSLGLARAQVERAALDYDLGNYDEALLRLDEATGSLVRVEPGDHALAVEIDSWRASALLLRSDLEGAKRAAERSLEMAKRVHGRPSAAVANAMVGLANVLRTMADWDGSLLMASNAANEARAVYGNDHLEVAHAVSHMAESLERKGQYDEALARAREALAIRRSVFDGPHVEVGASLGSVAGILKQMGRLEESEAARRESLAVFIAAVGDEPHPYVAATLASLGGVLIEREKYDEAEQVLRDSVAQHRAAYPPGAHEVAFALTEVGRLMLALDRPAEAEAAFREALETRVQALGSDHYFVGVSRTELGEALDALGRDEEAETELLAGLKGLRTQFGEGHPRLEPVRGLLHAHYLRRGQNAKAAPFAADPQH